MTPSPTKTIFIMDDSPIILDMLRVVFEDAGYAVATAVNIAELDAVRANASPDLYILDVQMPEAFGDQLGHVLRDAGNVRVPILLFSALEEAELATRCREAQLDGFVSKGAGPRALLARVTTLLGEGAS